jgi:hypothetical protein
VTGKIRRTTIANATTYAFGNANMQLTFTQGSGVLPTQITVVSTIGSRGRHVNKTTSVQRLYQVLRTGGSGACTFTLRFPYLDAELDTNTESRLVIWDHHLPYAGVTPHEHGKTNQNTTQNWIELAAHGIQYLEPEAATDRTKYWIISSKESNELGNVWLGAATETWDAPANWNRGVTPAADSMIIIPSNAARILNLTGARTAATFEIQSGATVEAGSATLTLTGAPAINGGAGTWLSEGTFNAGTSTVIFDNIAATIAGNAVNFHNLTINSGRAATLQADGQMTISGNFTNNGTFDALSNSTVTYNSAVAQSVGTGNYHNLVLSGAGTKTMPATVNIKNNLEVNAAWDVTTNTTNLVFNGLGATQSITSNQNPTVFHSLTMNNVQLIIEDHPIEVNGTLALTEGELQPGDNNITINGPITRSNGSILLFGSKLIMAGTAVQSIPALTFTNNEAYELEINKSGGNVTLDGTVKILKELQLTNGQLNTGGHLILTSTGVGSARIAPLGSGASITGNVTVQRYIQDLGATTNLRRWRFLSSPVQNETVAGWQRSIFVTGPGGSTNGFDNSPNNAHSVFWYNEATPGNVNLGWTGPANANETLPLGRGYRVFVRGDRAISPASQFSSTATQSPVTMDVLGPVNTGTIHIPLTMTFSGPGSPSTRDTLADGWNLVGNPYPSAIDWKKFWDEALTGEKENIWPIIYLYNAQAGNYITYNALVTPDPDFDYNIIPSGASFWVRAIDLAPTMVLKEAYKAEVDLTTASKVFKSTNNAAFRLKLVRDSFNYDLLSVHYLNGSSVNVDAYDIPKLFGGVTITSWTSDSTHLAQTVRPLSLLNDTIRLNVAGGNGTYRLEFLNSANVSVSDNIYLVDQFTSQVIDMKSAQHYTFSITNNAASQGMSRFYIVVQSPQSVPVKMIYFNATATADKKVSVNWATSNEINSKQFVVERSSDANNFEAIGTVEAAGNSTQIINYNFTDKQPLRVGYYRIKQVDLDGSVAYTDIRRVAIDGASQPEISVYPNPATEYVRISAAGRIGKLEVIDGFGKAIKTIESNSNIATVDVNGLMSGIYFLRWIDENGSAQVHGFMVE